MEGITNNLSRLNLESDETRNTTRRGRGQGRRFQSTPRNQRNDSVNRENKHHGQEGNNRFVGNQRPRGSFARGVNRNQQNNVPPQGLGRPRQENETNERNYNRGRPRQENETNERNYNRGRPRQENETNQRNYNRLVNYRRLQYLKSRTDNELIEEIETDRSGFPQALNDPNIYENLNCIRDVIAILNRSISSLILLSKVKTSDFLTKGLTNYYFTLYNEFELLNQDTEKYCFHSSIVLLKTILEKFPSSHQEIFPSITTVKLLITDSKVVLSENTVKIFEQLEELSLDLKGQVSKRTGPTVKKVFGPPPDNFRDLSIFPERNMDIMIDKEPYLRPIDLKKGFDDVEQYLDIHFRLLKEDFVRPLRNGIKEYLNPRNDIATKKRFSDIKVYQGVRILNPVCSQKGLFYKIVFDVKNLKNVKWEFSKRFIFGSLLCLSSNDFEDIFLATVADRDPKTLSQGCLTVQFENKKDELKYVSPSHTFVMIETTAYFEAYRHVLKALQEMTPNDFPFQETIIHCANLKNPPTYTRAYGSITYDFSSLCPNEKNRCMKNVSILDEKHWPSAETLGLDESQKQALVASLTTNVALVQGPPGTGKTFIGLKIVQVLIDNWTKWNINDRPILVICYTNHALDQFLEGISTFLTSGIVRVGGRSKNKAMENFLLNHLRNDCRGARNVPKEIHNRRKDIRTEMEKLQGQIESRSAIMDNLRQGLFHENFLRTFMDREHFDSLTSRFPNPSCNSHVVEWLQSYHFNYEDPAEEEIEPVMVNEDEAFINIEDEAELEGHERLIEDEKEEIINLQQQRIKLQRIRNKKEADEQLALNIDNMDKNGQTGEWQMTKENRKKQKQRVKQHLLESGMMTNEEVKAVKNVWTLTLKQRWKLYTFWANRYMESIRNGIVENERIYQLWTDQLRELLEEEDTFLLERTKVIGMTTTGAAKYKDVLKKIKPKIVIVEEAAEVLECHITTNLSSGCEHLILIGDHKQLRPNPTVYKLGTDYNLNCSLFERLIINKVPFVTLEHQHRMRPQISDFARLIYPNLEDDDSVQNYENVLGVGSNVFFINHNEEEARDVELMSKSNHHEAAFLARLCKYLIQQGYSPEQITILTPYAGQMFTIRKCMPKQVFQGVRVCPIDNYQGEENDIILLSLVRSNRDGCIGFLKEDNRMCVAMTRAKKGLYVIGNFDMLRCGSPLIEKIYKKASESQPPIIGPKLSLYCQNHPTTSHLVSRQDDFDKVPEGGCMVMCQFRLPCGHTCTRACHGYDRDHKEFKCIKPCAKIVCPENHRCTKSCFDKCGRCETKVARTMPNCFHTQMMKCYQSVEKFGCQDKCATLLTCGHNCAEPCGKSHTDKCKVQVSKRLKCGHLVKLPCHRFFDDEYSCSIPCSAKLECGHKCPGTCGSCFEGRVHVKCNKKCERNLVCGHKCMSNCSKDCPPCSVKCGTKCTHSVCQKKCGEPCVPCTEKCLWTCEHHACTKLCCQPCDRDRCNEPCQIILKCNHKCVGLCGEPCPKLCAECDKEKLTEIFFGNEDEEGARFVQLNDCRHVLEVEGLDKWIDESSSNSSSITPICCPKCKAPIRNSVRYGPEIKSVQNKIEKVKSKIFGNSADLELQKDVLNRKLQRSMSAWSNSILENIEKNVYSLGEVVSANVGVDLLKHIEKCAEKFTKQKSYLKKLENVITENIFNLSPQQLDELQYELTRLDLLIMFEECKTKFELVSHVRLTQDQKNIFLTMLTELEKCKLDKKLEERARTIFKETTNLMTGLGITEVERVEIVKALGDVQRGAWFECPNGHVYAIGDCGGATIESKCNECGARIGGGSHALRPDNRWNNLMDGSQATAWPGTAMNPR